VKAKKKKNTEKKTGMWSGAVTIQTAGHLITTDNRKNLLVAE